MRAALVAAIFFGAGSSRLQLSLKSNVSSEAAEDPSSCGVKPSTLGSAIGSQVVNGKQANACEWGWLVTLSNGGDPWCGGSLIAEDWVLTAAHCLGRWFQVVAGDESSGQGQTRKVMQNGIIAHPNYSADTNEFDFALVRLEQPFEMTSCVGTICLPTEAIGAGHYCTIGGYGAIHAEGEAQDTLRTGVIRSMANWGCKLWTRYGSDQIKESMMCARSNFWTWDKVDTCQGDSGGPLMCEEDGKWVLHGVTSWGSGCGAWRFPGVYARVSVVTDWIEEAKSTWSRAPGFANQ